MRDYISLSQVGLGRSLGQTKPDAITIFYFPVPVYNSSYAPHCHLSQLHDFVGKCCQKILWSTERMVFPLTIDTTSNILPEL